MPLGSPPGARTINPGGGNRNVQPAVRPGDRQHDSVADETVTFAGHLHGIALPMQKTTQGAPSTAVPRVRVLVTTPSEPGGECCVLFGRRGDDGVWGLPGGHFEPATDGSVLDTARREVLEETGISSTAITHVRAIGRDEATSQEVVELRVESRAVADAQLNTTQDPDAEFTEVKFWALRECASLHAYPDAKRIVAGLLGAHAGGQAER